MSFSLTGETKPDQIGIFQLVRILARSFSIISTLPFTIFPICVPDEAEQIVHFDCYTSKKISAPFALVAADFKFRVP